LRLKTVTQRDLAPRSLRVSIRRALDRVALIAYYHLTSRTYHVRSALLLVRVLPDLYRHFGDTIRYVTAARCCNTFEACGTLS